MSGCRYLVIVRFSSNNVWTLYQTAGAVYLPWLATSCLKVQFNRTLLNCIFYDSTLSAFLYPLGYFCIAHFIFIDTKRNCHLKRTVSSYLYVPQLCRVLSCYSVPRLSCVEKFVRSTILGTIVVVTVKRWGKTKRCGTPLSFCWNDSFLFSTLS